MVRDLVGYRFGDGFYININKFSIHSIYRERLIRAYLGASRTKERLKTANSFTGLDSENDNIEMKFLRHKPFHVVNMTLNLVKTQNLRWQNRKAESLRQPLCIAEARIWAKEAEITEARKITD